MIDSAAFPPFLVITGKAVSEDDADHHRHLCFSLPSAGQWSAAGQTLVARNSTTHPWTPGVSVQRLTRPPGWSPLLRTRWPSRPHAAPHTCGGPTQTHTWPWSPCSDSTGRSASRCDGGGHVDPGRMGDRLPPSFLKHVIF